MTKAEKELKAKKAAYMKAYNEKRNAERKAAIRASALTAKKGLLEQTSVAAVGGGRATEVSLPIVDRQISKSRSLLHIVSETVDKLKEIRSLVSELGLSESRQQSLPGMEVTPVVNKPKK